LHYQREYWTYNNVPASYKFYRGYTGHEQLDQLGLINMNGRMYDPSVGRFLSAHNVIQAPDLTQSYNRYLYCMNNPLKYTDPMGGVLHKQVIPKQSSEKVLFPISFGKGGFDFELKSALGDA